MFYKKIVDINMEVICVFCIDYSNYFCFINVTVIIFVWMDIDNCYNISGYYYGKINYYCGIYDWGRSNLIC